MNTPSTSAAVEPLGFGIDELVERFAYFDDWKDRYAYLIEIGRKLPPLPAGEQVETNKVHGCASQVWLVDKGDGHRMLLAGESDSHIVRGLVAILLTLYNGMSPAEAVKADVHGLFEHLGLQEHLTPSRSNGFFSMVRHVQAMAVGKA